MFGINNFGAFLVASVMLNLMSGPDTFYILGRSIAQGRGVGVASALGISAGVVVHTLAAALGLSALLAASASAFLAVKLAGAAYLIYLGLRLLFSPAPAGPGPATFSSSGAGPAFWQGLLTNVLNPKVALFFLAFLPQFIDSVSPARVTAFMALGLCFVLTSTLWCLCLAQFSSVLSRRLRGNPAWVLRLNRAAGVLLVGLGIRLATTR